VEKLTNRTASVYLRALLLTGAHREELAGLTWANVDFQWRKLTIRRLRRSFSLLGEAAGCSAGAIAQVIFTKPSATAEGYRPRRVDALRPNLEKIEAHILNRPGLCSMLLWSRASCA
jgi:integrase